MEAMRLMDQKQVKTETSQVDSSSRLKERTQDIETWREKLQRELNYLTTENEKLIKSRDELDHAIVQLKRPEDIACHNLKSREYRQGIDQVDDMVQVSLRTELQEVRRVREEMNQLMDTVEGQIAKNESVKKKMKHDIVHKECAFGIDDNCVELNNISSKIQSHPGIEQEDKTRSTPLSWDQHSDGNLKGSTDARSKSAELRGKVDGLLGSACKELMAAWSNCNKSFNERIKESENARKLSLENLEKTNHEISEIDYHIKLLKQAIKDKTNPLKLAETRVELRTHRPNLEGCSDVPHAKLKSEVDELNDSIKMLKAKLEESQEARAKLITARASLQQDIRVKENSLSIDRGKCMGSRIKYPHNQRFMATNAAIAEYTLSQPGSYNKCKARCDYKWCAALGSFTMMHTAEVRHVTDTDLKQINISK